FSGLSRRYKKIKSLALDSISSLPNQEKGNNTKVDNQISGELKILGDAVKSGRYIRLSREKSREALALQRLLNSIGYTLKEDGIPGPKTTEALRDFQRQNGLKPDGIFGPKSLERLHAIAATTKK
ncbi:MAG: peptidoglycan-binding protein, partial [Candidatus Dadabacteria bacterium]